MSARLAAIFCLFAVCAPADAQLQTSQTLSTQDQIRQSYLAQTLDAPIPLDASFLDDSGNAVRLGDYFGHVPVLLVLGYFTCPDLCPMTFRHLTEELNGIAPVAGRDFAVIIVSFDPRDTPALAAEQKRSCLRLQMARSSRWIPCFDRAAGCDRRRRQGGWVSLHVRSGPGALRSPRRGHGAVAGGSIDTLFLRHRHIASGRGIGTSRRRRRPGHRR